MTVQPLVPDVPVEAPLVPDAPVAPFSHDAGAFVRALDAIGDALRTAEGAENAFASGGGSLHDAVYERARADVALAAATAAAQRTAQAVSAILAMQV